MTQSLRSHLPALAATLLLLLCRVSWAAPVAEKATASDEIIPPKAIYKVDPTHPPELYDRGIEGEAIIVASIDLFGSVYDPVVESATDPEFGLAAMLAASEWIFEPATKNGVPIELKVRIPFEFKIAFQHQLNVQMGREVFKELNGIPVIPSFELDQAPLPSFVPAFADFYPEEKRNSGISASASLEFIIDPNGNIINPRVISISAEGFEEAAIRAVAHMKYKPIKHLGQAVYVSLMMPIQLSQQ